MAPPGNQAETENTNIDLQRRKKLIYSTQYYQFSIALIEFDEGPIIGSNVIGCAPEAVTIGMPVTVVYEDITEEYTLPKFRPAT